MSTGSLAREASPKCLDVGQSRFTGDPESILLGWSGGDAHVLAQLSIALHLTKQLVGGLASQRKGRTLVVAGALGHATPPASSRFWWSVAWVVGLSTSTLLYLTPATTMLWAYVMSGDAITMLALGGLAGCAEDVALALRRPRRTSEPPISTSDHLPTAGWAPLLDVRVLGSASAHA